MEERIRQRIAALEQGERDSVLQLTVVKNLLIELRGLLAPDAPVLSGDVPRAHDDDEERTV